MHLPLPYGVRLTLLQAATKHDSYNPGATVDDWDAPPYETPLGVCSWLDQDARLAEDPVRHLVAWRAQIGIPDPTIRLKPGNRIRRDPDETVWQVVGVTPASTSPFTGWCPGSTADLELPTG